MNKNFLKKGNFILQNKVSRINFPEQLGNTDHKKGTQQTSTDEEFHSFNGEYAGTR